VGQVGMMKHVRPGLHKVGSMRYNEWMDGWQVSRASLYTVHAHVWPVKQCKVGTYSSRKMGKMDGRHGLDESVRR